MCGFLNSGGGILYLGVSDDGAVLGIEMTPDFEETMREDIVEVSGMLTLLHKKLLNYLIASYLVDRKRVRAVIFVRD